MKRPDITPGEWHVAGRADLWAGKLGLSLLHDADSVGIEATRADVLMMAAAPDMFDALNAILAEARGRGVQLDNATRAILAMHKAGGQLGPGGEGMSLSLASLVKEAEQLVYVPMCNKNGHAWIEHDCARACPRGGDGSQQVYICANCGDIDYGTDFDKDGPGYRDCFVHGPCSPHCVPVVDEEVET